MSEANIRKKSQCLLMSFIDILTQGSTEGDTSRQDRTEEFQQAVEGDSESEGESSTSDVSATAVGVNWETYSEFVKVYNASPATLLNKLVTRPDLQELFALRTDQMAAVMPKLKLYKMIYSGADDLEPQAIPFRFNTHITEGDISSLTTGATGRAQGVGIKSFDWKLLGTNTAEVDNNIKATLTLQFQSFADLVSEDLIDHILQADAENLNCGGFSAATQEGGRYEAANYIDLFFRAAKFRDGDREQYNSKYYRIKAVLGWTVDRAMVDAGVISSDLRDRIEGVGTTLLLSLLSHDLDFREDGTIELKLEYHAAIEALLTSRNSNVLFPDAGLVLRGDAAFDIFRQMGYSRAQFDSMTLDESTAILNARMEQLTGELDAARAEDDDGTEGAMPPEDDSCPADGGPSVRGDLDHPWYTSMWTFGLNDYTAEEQIQDELEQVRRHQAVILSNTYNRILRELMGDTYWFDVDERVFEVELNTIGQVGSLAVNWEEVFAYELSNSGRVGRASTGPGDEIIEDYLSNMRAEMQQEAGDQDQSDPAAPDVMEDIPELPINDGKRRVYWFRLGALINIVLRQLRSTSNADRGELQNLRLVIGTALVGLPSFRNNGLNYLAPVSGGQREALRVGANRYLVNIADIPISLHLFLQFFTDRVIARNRQEWPFKTFIKELFSYIVMPALGSACAARDFGRRPNITISHVSAYGDEGNNSRLPDNGRIVFESEIPNLPMSARVEDRRQYEYMLVSSDQYISPQRIATEPDSPERDEEDGIYWLNIGNDRGLVKSIKFKKTEVQGAREARMEREGEMGMGQLRDKYDADIMLYGNNLFQPGQIIYINPTAMGLSSPMMSTKLSSVLGIGGYYQIIDVDSTIRDVGYETGLNCFWVASGTGIGDYECDDDPCAEPTPPSPATTTLTIAGTPVAEVENRTLQQENRAARAAHDPQGRRIAFDIDDPDERQEAWDTWQQERYSEYGGRPLPSTWRGERISSMDYDVRMALFEEIRQRRAQGLPDIP